MSEQLKHSDPELVNEYEDAVETIIDNIKVAETKDRDEYGEDRSLKDEFENIINNGGRKKRKRGR
jgi:hypothetical protein